MARGPHRYFWVALVAGLLFPASTSWAQAPSAKAAAQALFDDGLRLMARKKYDSACPKLEESERLDPAMGTRFQLAQCYEALGRTASAWAGFLEVADLARVAGQGARERAARERAASVEAKVNHLVIDVATPDLKGLEIHRDGLVLGSAQWGVAIPVDPGAHHVIAEAPSRTPWASDVTVSGTGGTTRVLVPPLPESAPTVQPAPSPPPSPPAPTPASSPVEAPPPPSSSTRIIETPPTLETSHASTQRTFGIVAASAGVLAVGASIAVGLVARSDYDSTGNHCNAAGCDPEGKQTTDSARRLGDVGTGLFAAGAVLAVGGGVLWLTAPSHRVPAAPAAGVGLPSMSLRVVPGVLTIDGRFW